MGGTTSDAGPWEAKARHCFCASFLWRAQPHPLINSLETQGEFKGHSPRISCVNLPLGDTNYVYFLLIRSQQQTKLQLHHISPWRPRVCWASLQNTGEDSLTEKSPTSMYDGHTNGPLHQLTSPSLYALNRGGSCLPLQQNYREMAGRGDRNLGQGSNGLSHPLLLRGNINQQVQS